MTQPVTPGWRSIAEGASAPIGTQTRYFDTPATLSRLGFEHHLDRSGRPVAGD